MNFETDSEAERMDAEIAKRITSIPLRTHSDQAWIDLAKALDDRVARQDAQLRAQADALAHWRREVDRMAGELARAWQERNALNCQCDELLRDVVNRADDEMRVNLEDRVKAWVIRAIGPDHMHRRERAMRLLEEAFELAQSEGIDWADCCNQAVHVYSRPAGEPSQEAGGVAVCLLGWCAATGTTLQEVALREIERIEAKPDADLVTVVDK